MITHLRDQDAQFKAGLEKHRAELGILHQQIAALEQQISGHNIQKKGTKFQIDLLSEEREAFEELLAKGLTRKSQVLTLRRSEADLKGREGQLAAAIAQAKRSIAEVRERIAESKGARIEDASARLAEARAKRLEVLEQLRAAEDVSERVAVKAPVSGTVIRLTKYNSGAVAPGQQIITIVSEGAALVVEAQVRPQDIDKVRVGQVARLTFSAFGPRQIPPRAGTVVYISADRLENERTGATYYRACLEISPESAPEFDRARTARARAGRFGKADRRPLADPRSRQTHLNTEKICPLPQPTA